ncbi:MAG: gluconeogenesis factor YvcK family protein [Deltaproteobacteria bacterium]
MDEEQTEGATRLAEAERGSMAIALPLRAVALGGGTGLPVVLRGLRCGGFLTREARPLDVTAIVTMSDDGGSSGRLRRELGMLPPGDIRNCLVALSGGSGLSPVFQYRFRGRRELGGHTVGNVVIAALSAMHGDFLEAVRSCGRLLGAVGRVLPSTLTPVTLVGERLDGSRIAGESRLARGSGRLARVRLDPSSAVATPGVLQAIERADLVVLGPGSLFTSIVPNLLVRGVARALERCPGRRVLVLNAMTQPGETAGMSAADHVRAIQEVAGPRCLDVVLVNRTELSAPLLRRYRGEGSEPVRHRREELLALGVAPIETTLVSSTGRRVRHDPLKLGDVLHSLVGRGVGHA